MSKDCVSCGISFEITDEDLAFYDKVSPTFAGTKYQIPPPVRCPACRLQRRMAHRNERSLYHRKCDLTGKQMISMYSPDSPYTVYDQNVWWSDQFDPLQYGREFDFSRPFFEQFKELELVVPKSSIINANSENCDYTNYSAENRNCYLDVGTLQSEDIYYSYRVFYSKDVCDCYDLYKCERCYECTESSNLYDCQYSSNCHNSADLILCEDCTGCKDCLGCINLRNKQFHIYNQPFSEQDYRQKVMALKGKLNDIGPDIEKLHFQVPHRFARLVQCEDSSGDQLLQCKDCTQCFTVKYSQDCRHCWWGETDRDCVDCNHFDQCEMQYHNCNNQQNYNAMFGSLIWYCKHAFYSMNCFNSNHIFGCTGMKKHEYCILNKQYSQQEYMELVARIAEHMQQTEEWATFLPIEYSAFGYNETLANDYFPLTKEAVLKRGWQWRDDTEKEGSYLGPEMDLTQDIFDVDDSICEQILLCEETKRPYKIIPQELKFYRDMGISIPKRCPDQRHKDRMAKLNPRQLWDRRCAKCNVGIKTTYAPDHPEIVYCEECYLQAVS